MSSARRWYWFCTSLQDAFARSSSVGIVLIPQPDRRTATAISAANRTARRPKAAKPSRASRSMLVAPDTVRSRLLGEFFFDGLGRVADFLHRRLQLVGGDSELVRPIAHFVVFAGIDAAAVLRPSILAIIAHLITVSFDCCSADHIRSVDSRPALQFRAG